METKVINLERAFIMRPPHQLQELLFCLEKVNQLIREKNNLADNIKVLWAKNDGGKIRVGYNKNPKTENPGMHSNVILEYDITTNKAIFQFVVFDAINEWGLYNQISIYGAPEENKQAGLKFVLDETEYDYIAYYKK